MSLPAPEDAITRLVRSLLGSPETEYTEFKHNNINPEEIILGIKVCDWHVIGWQLYSPKSRPSAMLSM